MKLSLKGNGKFYIIGALILGFIAYKFVLPKLRGQPELSPPPFPAPTGPVSPPMPSAPAGGHGYGAEGSWSGPTEGGGLGLYPQSAPGPQFQQTTMPLTSVTAARVRLV